MNWFIKNTEEEYQLDRNFKPTITPYTRRLGMRERFGGDGAEITGDRKSPNRTISLKYNPAPDKDPNWDGTGFDEDRAYTAYINKLVSLFNPRFEPFYIVDKTQQRRMQIDLESSDDKPISEGLELRIGDNSMILPSKYSAWEDENENQSEVLALGNNDTFNLVNNSFLPCFVRFVMIAVDTVTTLRVENTTNGQGFTYGDPAFFGGAELVVSGEGEGIVELNGVDGLNNFSEDSGYIQLDPGSNDFEILTDGNITLQAFWRGRYPH